MMSDGAKILIGAVVGLVAGGGVALAVSAAKSKSSDDKPTPPPKPNPTPTPPPAPNPPPNPPNPPPAPNPTPTPPPAPQGTWKRATTIRRGERVRIAFPATSFALVAMSLGISRELDGFLDWLRSPEMNALLGTSSFTAWAPGSPQLPKDWPNDDPSPANEYHAEFIYAGTAGTLDTAQLFGVLANLQPPPVVWTTIDVGGNPNAPGNVGVTGGARVCEWEFSMLYALEENRWTFLAQSYYYLSGYADDCADGPGPGAADFSMQLSGLCKRGALAGIMKYRSGFGWSWHLVQCSNAPPAVGGAPSIGGGVSHVVSLGNDVQRVDNTNEQRVAPPRQVPPQVLRRVNP